MTTVHYLVTVHLNIDLPIALLQPEPEDAPTGPEPEAHACQGCGNCGGCGKCQHEEWKRVRTRYKIFRALHLPEWQVRRMANCRKGTWRAASTLNSVLTKTVIVDRLGYPSMTAHYLKVRVNY